VSACHAEGERSQLLPDVAQALTDLWGQHARSPRLATPILRTAEVLLSQTQILALEKDLSNILGRCLHTSWFVIPCFLLAKSKRDADAQKQNGFHQVAVLLIADIAALIGWKVWLLFGQFWRDAAVSTQC